MPVMPGSDLVPVMLLAVAVAAVVPATLGVNVHVPGVVRVPGLTAVMV